MFFLKAIRRISRDFSSETNTHTLCWGSIKNNNKTNCKSHYKSQGVLKHETADLQKMYVEK